ncbi:unnamed protein product [Pneumocystis jirovecii]|uniref:Uncharacterized protein n=1 Tax=Pneumocystis jirovecii TaxID=42068 RepID=L0PG00_PNEJI|nr:unnamed protein product [Pneumocystis jirovecii]
MPFFDGKKKQSFVLSFLNILVHSKTKVFLVSFGGRSSFYTFDATINGEEFLGTSIISRKKEYDLGGLAIR